MPPTPECDHVDLRDVVVRDSAISDSRSASRRTLHVGLDDEVQRLLAVALASSSP